MRSVDDFVKNVYCSPTLKDKILWITLKNPYIITRTTRNLGRIGFRGTL